MATGSTQAAWGDGSRRLHRALPWLLVLLSYWATYAVAMLVSSDMSWPLALLWSAVGIVPEAALSPLALAISRRHAWDRVPLWRFLLVHLAGAALFISVSVAWLIVALSVGRRLETGQWQNVTSLRTMVWREILTLLVYAAVCSIGQASAFAQRAREEQERAVRAEALRAKAQLASLRAQLNPHFILNLLHSLLGLVSRDPRLAAAALERLGDVLRYVLRVQHQTDDEVAFDDEWSFVKDYLSLERLRLDRLRVHLEADPEARMARLPAFVLQPLVENAVRHAVAPRAEGGQVLVTARCANGCLRLAVEDDGGGRPEGNGPPDVHRDDPLHSTTGGSGLGLALARERLAALYGDRAQLRTGISSLGGFGHRRHERPFRER